VLVWYYATLSQIQTVYGSLTTTIATLLSVEIAALVLLLGAQVISDYERIGREPVDSIAIPSRPTKLQARPVAPVTQLLITARIAVRAGSSRSARCRD
jgi:uncharacterized BrkB/YihY/UPF0761 family membrane protein